MMDAEQKLDIQRYGSLEACLAEISAERRFPQETDQRDLA